MATSALVLLVAPGLLVGLFLDRAQAASGPVFELAVSFVGVAALFQLVDGAQAVGAGALRGLKDTRVPMLFAALGYWGVGVPLSAALAFVAGLDGFGVWLGLAAGLAVVAVLMVVRWARRHALGLV
jgi:MATE family multidrug resistance protein